MKIPIPSIRPCKNLVFPLILSLVVGSLLQLLFPFLIQAVVDIGIKEQSIQFIYLILLALLMLTFGVSAVGFFRGWLLLHVRIRNLMANSALSSLFSMFNTVIFGIVLLYYSISVFFVFLIGSLFYYFWVYLFMKKRVQTDQEIFTQSAANQSKVVQFIQGMQDMRLNACEQRRILEWENIQAKLFDLRMKGMLFSQYQDSGALFINQIKNIIITFLTAKFVIESQMTLGVMLSVQYILGQLNGSTEQLTVFLRQAQDAGRSLERLSEIQKKEEEETEESGQTEEIPQRQNIIMKHVCFAYPTPSVERNVLHNINLTIETNKQTAIVGTTGCGKTTIIKLLLGYYPVKEGNIYIGNTELNAYSWKKWRQKCGVVMQEGFIFSDTIARNIAPGDDALDEKKMKRAVAIANIEEFIESLPLSYNTKIGSEGVGLSQGQKQQILIARAVYKDPEFVFFDEATDSLATDNALEIVHKLTSFFKNRTVLIVSNRLGIVRNADKIIVMDNGSIAEVGKHEALMLLKGKYYHLVKNQLELE